MKTESNVMPRHPFEVEGSGDFVDILFYDDVKVVPASEEREEHYEYDLYRLSGIRNRSGLEGTIADNFEDWFSIAKQKGTPHAEAPKVEDRISMVEEALLFLTLGGM